MDVTAAKDRTRPARLMLVEDEADLLEQNRRYLTGQGYEVSCAPTLAEARRILRKRPPDLIILDVNMTDGCGYDFCSEIRPLTSAPIIYLTCMDKTENIVHGLMEGGNDYITKPFDLHVLTARIIAQLRQSGLQGAGRIEVPPLSVDLQSGQAYLKGERIQLTQKEMQLLAFFASHIGKEFSADEIYTAVWTDVAVAVSGTIKKHVSMLRKKLSLDRDGAVFEIYSTRNQGYVFTQLIDEPEW